MEVGVFFDCLTHPVGQIPGRIGLPSQLLAGHGVGQGCDGLGALPLREAGEEILKDFHPLLVSRGEHPAHPTDHVENGIGEILAARRLGRATEQLAVHWLELLGHGDQADQAGVGYAGRGNLP
jgi:hypothetical protein